MPYLNLETKMQEKITEFVNDTFKNIFNIPFSIINGNLNEYKKNKLPNTGGIYFIYCDKLGLSYIGMTESNVTNRFKAHIGRADEGKDYDKRNPHKVWDYFHNWCKTENYSLQENSKYIFVSFENNITKKQLEFFESGVIFKFKPLLNSNCFEWFGYSKLQQMRGIK